MRNYTSKNKRFYGSLYINNNSNLTHLAGLDSLVAGGGIGGEITICGNQGGTACN